MIWDPTSVIDRKEDESSGGSGSVRIMLFEHAYPVEDETAEVVEDKKKSAPLVNNGALSRHTWLHGGANR